MRQKHITEREIISFRGALIEEEKSAATVPKYVRDLRAFARFAADGAVDKELVIRYKQELVERYAPASVNSMLAAVNRFFRHKGWHDCVVKTVRVQRQNFRDRDRELSRNEYYRLVEAARRRKDDRLCLLMQTICATGIRVGELRFITVESLETGRATVSLKGKTRQVLLPRALVRELRRYAQQRGLQTGSIFVTRSGVPLDRSNILHAMKALCETAGVARGKVFPHNLRHLFACLYYKVSKDLSRLADLLGHSSVNTTRIYTSVNGSEQARQIERLGLVL